MLRPIKDVAFDKTGRKPSHATQWRWIRHGVRGVKLGATFVGGRWMTTDELFDQFTSGQTAKRLEPEDADDTESQLRAAGLL